MKTVVMHLEDEEHRQLIEKKGDMIWIEFIMQLTNGDD